MSSGVAAVQPVALRIKIAYGSLVVLYAMSDWQAKVPLNTELFLFFASVVKPEVQSACLKMMMIGLPSVNLHLNSRSPRRSDRHEAQRK
nr:MAG TPA: hypothetical protein [Caudoviricetes sp.]